MKQIQISHQQTPSTYVQWTKRALKRGKTLRTKPAPNDYDANNALGHQYLLLSCLCIGRDGRSLPFRVHFHTFPRLQCPTTGRTNGGDPPPSTIVLSTSKSWRSVQTAHRKHETANGIAMKQHLRRFQLFRCSVTADTFGATTTNIPHDL